MIAPLKKNLRLDGWGQARQQQRRLGVDWLATAVLKAGRMANSISFDGDHDLDLLRPTGVTL